MSSVFANLEVPQTRPIVGVIRSMSGDSPGPASGIRYVIGVNYGGITFDLESQVPTEPRWADDVSVVALPAGAVVRGDIDELTRTVYWWFRELPATMACQDTIGMRGNPMRPPVFGSGFGTGAPSGGGGTGGEGTIGPSTGPPVGGGFGEF